MVLSVPVIALGATLGTATSILALCGLTCLCKCKRPGKGSSDKEQDLDAENAKPRILQTVQQVKHIVEFFPRFRLTVCNNEIYSNACKVSGTGRLQGRNETEGGEGGSGGLYNSQSNNQLLFLLKIKPVMAKIGGNHHLSEWSDKLHLHTTKARTSSRKKIKSW